MMDDRKKTTIGEIIAKALSDEAFRQRLLRDATKTLREEGLPAPEGVEVRAVENTASVTHLVLPARPATGELDPATLAALAGGAGRASCAMGLRPDVPQEM